MQYRSSSHIPSVEFQALWSGLPDASSQFQLVPRNLNVQELIYDLHHNNNKILENVWVISPSKYEGSLQPQHITTMTKKGGILRIKGRVANQQEEESRLYFQKEFEAKWRSLYPTKLILVPRLLQERLIHDLYIGKQILHNVQTSGVSLQPEQIDTMKRKGGMLKISWTIGYDEIRIGYDKKIIRLPKEQTGTLGFDPPRN